MSEKHHSEKSESDETRSVLSDGSSIVMDPVLPGELESCSSSYTVVEDNENDVKFYVSYLKVPHTTANLYLYRRHEQAYIDACNQPFVLSLFPAQLKDGVRYQPCYERLSRVALGTRIRRLILKEQIEDCTAKLKSYADLLGLCEEKQRLHLERIVMLENELDRLKESNPSGPSSRFNALLCMPMGWRTCNTFLSKEYKRLQKPKDDKDNFAEDVDRTLTMDIVNQSWGWLQLWRLVHSVEFRCRLGEENYPKEVIHFDSTIATNSLLDDTSLQTADDEVNVLAPSDVIGPMTRASSKAPSSADEQSVSNGSSAIIAQSTRAPRKSKQITEAEHSQYTTNQHQHRRNSRRISDGEVHVPEGISLFAVLPGKRIEGNWEDVCRALGSSDESLHAVLTALLDRLTWGDIATLEPPLIEKVSLTNLIFGLKEMHETDGDSPFLAAVMTSIADSIGNRISDSLLHALRIYPSWLFMLEEIRKDRVRHEGGKLLVKEEGSLEIDIKGGRHLIPHVDPFVDTDVLHNAMQRVHVKAAIPNIIEKIDSTKVRRRKLRGELACVVQFGYSYVMPFLQRVFRRTIVQKRLPLLRRNLVYFSIVASAVIIQSFRRRLVKTREYRELLRLKHEELVHRSATILGARIRGWTKWHVYNRHRTVKKAESKWFAITRYQAMIRGFIQRRRLIQHLEAIEAAKKKETNVWAAVKIQKMVRGMLARRVLVQSIRMRQTLSPEILKLAELYLQKGNLWGFLREIDGEITRLKQQLTSVEEREENWATTFVEKVIAKRQTDFDSSWNLFSQTVEAHGGTKLRNAVGEETTGSVTRPSDVENMFLEDGRLSALGSLRQHSAITEDRPAESPIHGTGSVEFPSSLEMPSLSKRSLASARGNLLEAPLSAAMPVKSAASSKFQSSRSLASPSFMGSTNRETTANSHVSFEDGNSAAVMAPLINVPGVLLRRALTATVQDGVDKEMARLKKGESRTAKLADDIRKVYTESGRASAGKPLPTSQPVKTPSRRKRDLDTSKPNTMGASTSDWVTKAATGTSSATKPSAISSPLGRTRREDAASEKVNDADDASNVKGHRNKKIKPKSHADHIEPGQSILVDIPRGLQDTLERLLRAAAMRCYVPAFFSGVTVEEAQQMYLQMPSGLAKMRYEQEVFGYCKDSIHFLFLKGLKYIESALPISKFVMFMKSVNAPTPLTDTAVALIEVLIEIGPVVPLGYSHRATIEQGKAIARGESTVSDSLAAYRALRGLENSCVESPKDEIQDSDEDSESYDFATRVLLSMTENGQWMHLHAPIDDLLLQAAYLVCPHQSVREIDKKKPSVDMLSEEAESEIGQEAFVAHIKELQTLDEEMKRAAVRQRYRFALLISAPYSLSLKAMQVFTVLDLIKVPLNELQMPKAYQDQVETLLNICVAATTKSKTVPVPRSRMKSNKELFNVPMHYDPKFQRSPFDPIGRPARVGTMSSYRGRLSSSQGLPSQRDLQSSEGVRSETLLGESGSEKDGLHGLWNESSLDSDSLLNSINASESWKFHWINEESNGSLNQNSLENRKSMVDSAEREGTGSKVKFATDIVGESLGKSGGFRRPDPPNNIAEDMVHIGKRDANHCFLPQLVPASAMEASQRKTAGRQQSKSLQSSIDGGFVQRTTTARLSRREEKSLQIMHRNKRDFITSVHNDFERPFVCKYPRCGQAFSRLYTLKVHEKSHEYFQAYHDFKRAPQLCYDS